MLNANRLRKGTLMVRDDYLVDNSIVVCNLSDCENCVLNSNGVCTLHKTDWASIEYKG